MWLFGHAIDSKKVQDFLEVNGGFEHVLGERIVRRYSGNSSE